jgi:hypothetical protein
MSPAVWRALLGLELRRAVVIAGRLLLFSAVAAGLLALSGSLSASRGALLLSIAATAFAVQVPVGIVRDKLDGGLEFLLSLPVPPAHLAAGRFAAAILCCLPASGALVLALHVSRPDLEAVFPGGASGAFLAMWAGLNLLCTLLVGIALRFDARTALYLPMGMGFVAAALDETARRMGWDVEAPMRWLLTQPWVPGAVRAIAVLGFGGLMWLSFHLGRTGLERYTPGGDRITW